MSRMSTLPRHTPLLALYAPSKTVGRPGCGGGLVGLHVHDPTGPKVATPTLQSSSVLGLASTVASSTMFFAISNPKTSHGFVVRDGLRARSSCGYAGFPV